MPIKAPWEYTDPTERAHFQRVRDLSDVLCTHDDPGVELAVEALIADRPAFWRTSGYGDQWTGGFMPYANRASYFHEAHDAYCAAWQIEAIEPTKLLHILDHLIPLNDEAVTFLQMAYQKLGTFREEAEIEGREAVAFRDADKAQYPLPADRLAACRARFAARQAEIETSHKLLEAFAKSERERIANLDPHDASARLSALRDEAELHPERAAAVEPEITALDALFSDRATERALERL